MGIIAVVGAAMFGAFLGFVTYMILDRRCYLTDDDYKIINAKFEDVWKTVQETKYRVRQLEDARKDNSYEPVELSKLRPNEKVKAWHADRGWVDAIFYEKCCATAFVGDKDGHFWWTYMVRKADD